MPCRYSDRWAGQHFLHGKIMKKAREVREQLQDIMGKEKLDIVASGTDWDIIRKCICSGFFHQAAKAKGMAEYLNLRTGISMHLHPTSALYGLGTAPEYVVYHELILTSKQYASIVTTVDPLWLAEVGAVFFSVRHQHFSDKQRSVIRNDFDKQSELELEMAKDAAQAEEDKQERLRAEKSAAATPRVATSECQDGCFRVGLEG